MHYEETYYENWHHTGFFSKSKNDLLCHTTLQAVSEYEHSVINFGCFEKEAASFSYIEIALEISLLLSSHAVDFIITGCSSGQGMMLACNSLPGVLCGYVPTPQDAYLFGRINDGNAVSFPLGLNFGWSGELNLKYTLEKLFDGPFGTGYPTEDAARKQKDTLLLKKLNAVSKKDSLTVYQQLDKDLVKKVLSRKNVTDYILEYGEESPLLHWIKTN